MNNFKFVVFNRIAACSVQIVLWVPTVLLGDTDSSGCDTVWVPTVLLGDTDSSGCNTVWVPTVLLGDRQFWL